MRPVRAIGRCPAKVGDFGGGSRTVTGGCHFAYPSRAAVNIFLLAYGLPSDGHYFTVAGARTVAIGWDPRLVIRNRAGPIMQQPGLCPEWGVFLLPGQAITLKDGTQVFPFDSLPFGLGHGRRGAGLSLASAPHGPHNGDMPDEAGPAHEFPEP